MFKQFKFFIQAAVIIIITIVDSCGLIFFTLIRKEKYNFFRHYRNWSKRVLWSSGIKLDIIGKENLVPNQAYIYVTNHSSLFDIPIIFCVLEDKVRIIYKKELERVPIFGWGLKLSPFIAISRSEPKNAMKSIEVSLESIKQNISVILYPEGHRSKSGNLQPFKRGAFLLASRSGKPIVPVAIIGSDEIIPKRSFHFNRTLIKVVIGKPVPPLSGQSKANELEQMQVIWETLNAMIQENK